MQFKTMINLKAFIFIVYLFTNETFKKHAINVDKLYKFIFYSILALIHSAQNFRF